MINIIRADMYRIVRGKAVYVTFALLAAFVAMTVATSTVGTIGVNMDGTMKEVAVKEDGSGYVNEKSEETDSWEVARDIDSLEFNGKNMVVILSRGLDMLVYFLLALVVVVATPIFSHGTLKNSLTYGTSRTKIYFAKLIVACGFCIAIVLFYAVFGVLLATALRGFGGGVDREYWINTLQVYGAQTFVLLSYACIGVFFAFWMRRTARMNGAYLAFAMLPTMLIGILADVDDKFIELVNYDLVGCIKKFAYVGSLSSEDVTRGFLLGACYMVATTVLGVVIFRRSEVR